MSTKSHGAFESHICSSFVNKSKYSVFSKICHYAVLSGSREMFQLLLQQKCREGIRGCKSLA